MPVVHQVFYIGRANVIDLLVEVDNVPVDFSAIMNMEVRLNEVGGDGSNDIVINTPDNYGGAIQWTSNGLISIKLGDIVTVPATYNVVLIAFDVDHWAGQVLAQRYAASELVFLGVAV